MKPLITAALLAGIALAGCESISPEALNRLSATISVFPRAADRQGIYAARDIRGSILVQYFPGEVSEATILQRLAPYCARQGGGTPRHSPNPTTRSEATLADGTTVATRSFVAQCR